MRFLQAVLARIGVTTLSYTWINSLDNHLSTNSVLLNTSTQDSQEGTPLAGSGVETVATWPSSDSS